MKLKKYLYLLITLILISSTTFILTKEKKNPLSHGNYSGVVVNGGVEEGSDIEEKNISEWEAELTPYMGRYHYGYSDSGFYLVLEKKEGLITAKIESGNFNEDKNIWNENNFYLSDVKIVNNKFYSTEYRGEFVVFLYENKEYKGLMLFKNEPPAETDTMLNFTNNEIGFSILQ
jgi:hypothetical protein